MRRKYMYNQAAITHTLTTTAAPRPAASCKRQPESVRGCQCHHSFRMIDHNETSNPTDGEEKLQLQLQVQKLTASVELLRDQLANQHWPTPDSSANLSPCWTSQPYTNRRASLDAAMDVGQSHPFLSLKLSMFTNPYNAESIWLRVASTYPPPAGMFATRPSFAIQGSQRLQPFRLWHCLYVRRCSRFIHRWYFGLC